MGMLTITNQLSIPEDELSFAASRSSGPGGQNVNKVETRITLRFSVDASKALDDEQKARIHEQLATRISKAGTLLVHAQKHRTQNANRELARERFVELLRGALERQQERRPTRVPRGVVKRRLEKKRRRSQKKRNRRRVSVDDH